MDSLFIITGSSKGIGLALVEQLLEHPSHHIIGIARSASPLTHERYQHFQSDLSDVHALIHQVDNFFPSTPFERIVLINNAGWIGQIEHVGHIEPENIISLYNLNVTAPAILCNAFAKAYEKVDAVKIVINISSGAAKKGLDGWSGYSSSKAAINLFTEATQNESNLNANGIRYFAVAPGVVDTAMQTDIRSAKSASFSSLAKFQGLYQNKQLSSPQYAAQKIIHLIENFEEFEGVLQDVREF
ncbi:SDR family NAD(P)-dependent oxidoreductase [Mongoliitalea daihaiensis]|uniref:SDR family NAD(P)-dependent oxidoreductase n=1 Tax=Mongoliitalea daihaiensis TaxID=2782006 RepID=UPI001F15A3B2|nr:SDR family NAD(P)-dependent oxidoreductase [Mongoliitalea daihaiensis]UJP66884.1 SDR family NAD(P)-dependent oxidoreductase [Mongoliitalea daihaiensis]